MWKNKKQKSLKKALKREAHEAIQHEARLAHGKKLHYTPHGAATEENLEHYNQAIFEWIAPEYIQHEKGKLWYAVEALVALFFLIISIVSANYTLTLAIVTFLAVYHYLHEKHPPKNIKITISPMGIKVGGRVFPYSHIQAFWVMYHPPSLKTLTLRVNKRLHTDIVIQLANENPVQIREYLCGQIPEWEGKNEDFSDLIVRLLKL